METLKKLKLSTLIVLALLLVPVVLVAQQVDSLIAEQIGEIAGSLSGIVMVALGAVAIAATKGLQAISKKVRGLPDGLMIVVAGGIQGLSQFVLGLLGDLGFPYLDQIPGNLLDLDVGSITLVLSFLGAQGAFHLYKKVKPSP